MSKLKMTSLIAVFLLLGLFISSQAIAGVCNVPSISHPTIQAAVADPTCDPINVAAGTYNENIVINRALSLMGAGSISSFINGINTGTNVAVVNITAAGNVTLSGFTITNAPTTNDDDLRVGVLTNSSSSGVTYAIVGNKVVGTNDPDNSEDYGIYGQNGGKENLLIANNVVTQTGSNGILIETHQGKTEISYNTLDAGCYGVDPIFVMTHSGKDVSNLQSVHHNTIDMGTGVGVGLANATGVSFCAVAGYYGVSPARFLANSIEITNNSMFNLKEKRRGLGFWNDASGDGSAGNITSPLVSGNNITGAPGTVTASMGIDTIGLVTNALITNNTVTGVDFSFKERIWNGHIATGTQLNSNNFSNNITGVLTERTSGILNAENNWWGCYDGPGNIGCDNASSNVDYIPWLEQPVELIPSFYWKDHNGQDPDGYMPDIDQNQGFSNTIVYALDFNDATNETMPGWTGFKIAAYSSPPGYGWDNTTGMAARKRAAGDALTKDLHFHSADRTFKIDLPNGKYSVTLYMGDTQFAHDKMDVTAEGTLVLNDISNAAGQVKELSFSVTVSDGQLNLLFHDDGGNDSNWVVNGVKVVNIDQHYCAPVAEANSLWWLDKKYRLGIFEFPEEGIGYIGADVNGDGAADILDLVQELANMMNTNHGHTGTTVLDEQAGIDEFLTYYGLNDELYEHTVYPGQYPNWLPYFSYIEEEVERSQDVKLDLGFWHVDHVEGQPGNWQVWWSRRGGHAVTVAGVDSQNFLLAISDPDNDTAEAGINPGVVRPVPGGHPAHPNDTSVHNIEANASHDIYTVGPSPSPGGNMGLLNFPWKWNIPSEEWEVVGPVTVTSTEPIEYCMTFTEIEAAVIVSPIICGNSHIDPGETCDPPGLPGPNQAQPGICRAAPPPACTYCGDGIVNNGEACDDGDGINNDECTNNCTLPTCGDGIIQAPETCDPAGGQWPPNGNPCRQTCTYCGDTIVNNGEQCDDGDANNSDNCNNSCIKNPDLVITSVTAPASAGAGTNITIGDTTKNNGPGVAGASTTRFYLSSDAFLNGGDTLLGSRAVLALALNASSLGNTSVTIPTSKASGPYFIIAKADGPDVIVEANDNNNTSPKAITVLPVTVVKPNGGEVIPSGSIYNIQWLASSNAVKFDLQYSMNNGGTWVTIASKVTGKNYNWTVPKPLNNKPNCLVKITGYDASNVLLGQDTSDAQFKIEVVKVTAPNGGENWKPGETRSIKWTTNGTKTPVTKVKLFYTYNGGTNWIIIYTLSSNPGTYNWRVPSANSANCKVKVVLKNKLGKTIGSDVSDAPFTISP